MCSSTNMYDHFTSMVRTSPKITALLFDDLQLTFEDLGRVTHNLADKLSGFRHIVICLPPSDAAICTMLAAWKLGCTPKLERYMPKKKALLSSLESDAVLVTDACDIAASNVVVIADIMHFNSGGNNHQDNPNGIPISLLTGVALDDFCITPEGQTVPMSHLHNRLEWEWKQYAFSAQDNALTLKPSHDLDFWVHVLSATLKGAPLVLPPSSIRGNYLEIADFCSEKKVSHLFVSPDELSDLATYFRVTTPLAKHIFLKSIKRITCSGDTLPLRSTYQDVMSSFSGVDTEVIFMLTSQETTEIACVGLPESQKCIPIETCRAQVEHGELQLFSDTHQMRTGLGGNGSGDCVFYSDVVANWMPLNHIQNVISQTLGHKEVAIFRDTFRGGLICFYRQQDAYWPVLFNKLYRLLKPEENPKLFPITGERPWAPQQYIEDYRECVTKLSEMPVTACVFEGSKMLFAMADRLSDVSIDDFEVDKSLSEYGATVDQLSLIAEDFEEMGFISTFVQDRTLCICDIIRQTLPIRSVGPEDRQFLVRILDENVEMEECIDIIADAFSKKNWLDKCIIADVGGSTREQHVILNRQLWSDIVQQCLGKVVLDYQTQKVLAVMTAFDFSVEAEIENLSEEFEAVLELHDQVDRKLREAFKDSKVAYIFQIASDADLSHEENVVIMKLLTDEIIEQAASENSGYHACLTHASHVFTQVIMENYQEFNRIADIDVNRFEMRGKKYFSKSREDFHIISLLKTFR
ncbi:uncharacterized protein LOC111268729 isoform X1 [Varroa jacobsoni]|uniref:uncharacterized protein LOC111268729 isoform X1 n=2 Tax=Varroa jacobsoni TaxID=62625 RepID=UPI000BF7FAC9|nr:uncharacterized protein LOC111268729 isoform X1 [Varroa jacobsoni]XP_022703608.1 uncharacterized protein LOC111268729 isoform X1 [Varroa jacobsoni]